MTPEVYASACCGGVFVPGYGPDDIHEAERGVRLVLEREEREVPITAVGAEIARDSERWERVHRITDSEATLYDAMRAGNCPMCGKECPGLSLVAGDGLGGGRRD